jgi:hypothetical protein
MLSPDIRKLDGAMQQMKFENIEYALPNNSTFQTKNTTWLYTTKTVA